MFGFHPKGPIVSHPSRRAYPALWRRLFHMVAGSATPVLGVFAPHEAMVSLLAALSATAILLETARFSHGPLNRTLVRWLKPLLKEGEEQKVTGATYMIIAGLGCFFFFDQGVAVAALLFLSVGDPVAALVGQRAPGPRLRGKSFLGSLALLLATVALSLILWQAGVASPLWVLLAGGCVASAVELIPLPLDDNATIPLISGGAMALLGA